jgi:hypothetical protein
MMNSNGRVPKLDYSALTPPPPTREPPSIFSPRGATRVIDWQRASPRAMPPPPPPGGASPRVAAAAPRAPRASPAATSAEAAANQLLEKLESYGTGEIDFTRRVHALLRTALDQAGLPQVDADAVCNINPTGFAALCARFDVACDDALAAQLFAARGWPPVMPLHAFVASFCRGPAAQVVSLHPKAGRSFPSSPRVSHTGGESALYQTLMGVSHEAELLRARTTGSPCRSPARASDASASELSASLTIKLETFATGRDFSRRIAQILRSASLPGAVGARAHAGCGLAALSPGLAAEPVGVTPAGVIAIGRALGLELSEAEGARILAHNGFEPAVPTPVHAFCDRLLNSDGAMFAGRPPRSTMMIGGDGGGGESSPVFSAALLRAMQGTS